MLPLVSVVVPVYNVSSYLPECIESILNQTYTEIQLILVDDGSTDESSNICDEYAKRDQRIIVIHKSNAGLGMARNTGIDHSSGEYICFIDGDDTVSNKHISELMNGICKMNADACYGGYHQQVGNEYYKLQNPFANTVSSKPQIIKEVLPRMLGKLNYRVIDEMPMSVCMTIYSLKLINDYKLRFLSERQYISEDLLFNIEFLVHASCVYISDSCGYYYRDNGTSLTKKYQRDRLAKQIILTKHIIEISKDLCIYEESEQRILSTFLAWVRNIVKSEQENYINDGFVFSLKRIKEVCRNDFVIWAVSQYDSKNLTRKPRILNCLIKHRLPILIWVSSFIKNK